MTPMTVFVQRKIGLSPRFVPLMKTALELFGASLRLSPFSRCLSATFAV